MTTTPSRNLSAAEPVKRAAFYFSAHPDDWQLFMNPQAFLDVLDATAKVIFIHVTAGDAGLGAGRGGRKHPLYVAREYGAESAIRFMADSNGQAPAEKVVSTPSFHGHDIRRIGYRNTVAYFLRLPDGSPAGTGYAGTGTQSLRRSADGEMSALLAIDGTTSYRDWTDLTMTLRLIIDVECGESSIDLHVPELDMTRNAGDHSDHYFTAKAALDAAAGLAARRIHHIGYRSAELPENLSGAERDMKAAVYAVTIAGILGFDHAGAWAHYDQAFVGRAYSRAEEAGLASI